MGSDEPFLSVAPKAFQSVELYFPQSKALRMIPFMIPVVAEHEANIALVLIGINNAAASHFFHGEMQEGSP